LNYEEQREILVVRILESSEEIEKRINETYEKVFESIKWHPSVREDQMPNFVAYLYDEIISLKALPTIKQFVDGFMRKYYNKVQPEESIYHAYVDRTSKAYESLVRDLHFYFKLKESNLFDNVLISYAYDIEAKQDIVVSLGDKKLGIQLFVGSDNHIRIKKKQTARRRIILGYPDFYLPLRGNESKPNNIGKGKNEFLVHSNHDVEMVYQNLKEVPDVSVHIEEETYVVPKVDIKRTQSPTFVKGKEYVNNIQHSFMRSDFKLFT